MYDQKIRCLLSNITDDVVWSRLMIEDDGNVTINPFQPFIEIYRFYAPAEEKLCLV